MLIEINWTFNKFKERSRNTISQVNTIIRPTIINNIPETILVTRIEFLDEIKFLTLDRNKIMSKFPIIGTEKETMEMTTRSEYSIFVKSKNPGNKVR